MEKRLFEKYFKLPLKSDPYAPFMVWTADNNRAFDFLIKDNKNKQKLVNKLNGEINDSLSLQNLTYKNGEIYLSDIKLLRIRSWGRLIGTGGGLGLSIKEATEIQNDFANWIIETLAT